MWENCTSSDHVGKTYTSSNVRVIREFKSQLMSTSWHWAHPRNTRICPNCSQISWATRFFCNQRQRYTIDIIGVTQLRKYFYCLQCNKKNSQWILCLQHLEVSLQQPHPEKELVQRKVPHLNQSITRYKSVCNHTFPWGNLKNIQHPMSLKLSRQGCHHRNC